MRIVEEVAHRKLPDGFAIIFFSNIGSFYEDGEFIKSHCAGYFVVGYTCSSASRRPTERARQKLRREKTFGGVFITLELINAENKTFLVFGTEEELQTVRKALEDTFRSREPLSIVAETEETSRTPYWWQKE